MTHEKSFRGIGAAKNSNSCTGYVVYIFNKNRVNLTNVAFTFRFRFILSVYSLVDWKTALIGRDSVLLLTAATDNCQDEHYNDLTGDIDAGSPVVAAGLDLA